MKKVKIFLCLCFLMLCRILLNAQGLQEIRDFGTNPGNLRMYLCNPDSTKSNSTKMPLVIALHGCTQTARTMSDESGWNELAKRYHFIVVYPQQKFLNNPSGCFNWFNKSDVEKDKGEVYSIKQMIDYMFKTYAIDSNQLFVYGLSAGAAMGVALLADYPNSFKSGAILAGGPYMTTNDAFDALSTMSSPKDVSSKELGNIVRLQNPDYKGAYPNLIVFHGEQDNVVNIKNSYLLIKQFCNLLHADTLPSRVDSSFQGNHDITKKIYVDSARNDRIIFYDVSNLGHALPVSPGDSAYQGGHTGMFSINKHFFSTYWIAKDFGLIKEK